MKRPLALLLSLFLLLPLLPARAAASPVIALTNAPAWGERMPFAGVVYTEDGSAFDPTAYRIALYLQIGPGEAYWVKPTFAMPYAEVGRDGSFSIDYVSGGKDAEAALLHLMLIPATYTPTSEFAKTRAVAVDYVLISRTPESVTVSPQRTPPEGEAGMASGLTVRPETLAVNVGFYTAGRPGSGLSEALIRDQLLALAPWADTVRFYSAAGEVAPAYEMAQALGLKVVGTAWLSGDPEGDRRELDALIDHANQGRVAVACVGSETLLRGDLTGEALIAYLDYVRAGLRLPIPVTTADDAGQLLSHGAVRAACDILMPNSYPFWEGIAADQAAERFIASMAALRASSPRKEILVSETGWPTEGQGRGEAIAGEAEAAAYFAAVRAWSLESGTQILWFDAADEPWKAATEGIAGAHWGFMTKELTLKPGYADTAFFREANARIGLGNFRRERVYDPALFTDVPAGAWYAENVGAAYALGLMEGRGGGLFVPLGEVKVSEVITLACRLHTGYAARSLDWAGGAPWYAPYVRYALAAGILQPGQFDSYDRPATRAEVAELLAAALPEEALRAQRTATVPDVTGAEPYAPAVFRLYAAGVLTGNDAAGTFTPHRTIRRAEVAAILTRMAEPALRVG